MDYVRFEWHRLTGDQLLGIETMKAIAAIIIAIPCGMLLK